MFGLLVSLANTKNTKQGQWKLNSVDCPHILFVDMLLLKHVPPAELKQGLIDRCLKANPQRYDIHRGPDVGTSQTKCSRGSTKIRIFFLPFAKSSINQIKVQNDCIFFSTSSFLVG